MGVILDFSHLNPKDYPVENHVITDPYNRKIMVQLMEDIFTRTKQDIKNYRSTFTPEEEERLFRNFVFGWYNGNFHHSNFQQPLDLSGYILRIIVDRNKRV